ncbi:DNA-binding response regulator [Vibrio sp. UCD-FRSSP16_10]|uniref:LytR/AlgR family response regulator transcription factor n=1 Tax=unclassified Vibrio TaxID=2614977 RepID=UPI0007FDB7FA|nr:MULTISPECIES: LytTR family DNA-binding domain-containing protein [unclassified Vibrio]OBT07894.1 DNA-binding response regulator [Vibrio sp. UCD-FRSSP16_30]OBT17070.1 DNA-binding response regulator [Vibrio sp. UCD-FRSSP16_10]
MTHTAILVEDEYLAREELKYLIGKYSDIQIVAEFGDGLQALEYLQLNRVDIAFLDINLPSINGMVLAKSLYNFKNPPKLIFTTAYKEHAVDAFEIDAFDYILKPFTEDRVKKSLDKLCASPIQASPNALNKVTVDLYLGDRIRMVEITDIIFAAANGKITEVDTIHGQFTSPLMLSDLIEKSGHSRFFKVHRSYWINLDRVEEIIPWASGTYRLKMQRNESLIPVSRSNIKEFRQCLGL